MPPEYKQAFDSPAGRSRPIRRYAGAQRVGENMQFAPSPRGSVYRLAKKHHGGMVTRSTCGRWSRNWALM